MIPSNPTDPSHTLEHSSTVSFLFEVQREDLCGYLDAPVHHALGQAF